MFSAKVKCIYCNKKIVPNQDYCPKCGRDIRKMWQTEQDEKSEIDNVPLFCPNPRCHASYTKGAPFCNLCGNDFKKKPPIPETDFKKEPVIEDAEFIYCPQCGAINKNNDLFCDCGCDFRTNPRVAKPPVRKKIFYCAICNTNRVNSPDEICAGCKMAEQKRTYYCPECRVNIVSKYGDICNECVQKKPLKGTGEGFHIAR